MLRKFQLRVKICDGFAIMHRSDLCRTFTVAAGDIFCALTDPGASIAAAATKLQLLLAEAVDPRLRKLHCPRLQLLQLQKQKQQSQ